MRFTALGSGSEGNALIIEHGATRLLLDCGLGLRETERRLALRGLSARELTAIIVTHEHADHIGGVDKLACKYDLPVWASFGTLNGAPHISTRLPRLCPFDSHDSFSIQDIEVQPFVVPHDAREPTQFVFSDGQHRLGVLTDTGHSTPHIEAMLSGLDALILECNHDSEMLANGRYPPSLKARVGGRFGHLSNAQAADLLGRLDCNRLQHLIAAHLSQHNNLPALAQAALAAVLDCAEDEIIVSGQQDGFDWRSLS